MRISVRTFRVGDDDGLELLDDPFKDGGTGLPVSCPIGTVFRIVNINCECTQRLVKPGYRDNDFFLMRGIQCKVLVYGLGL